MRLKGNSSPAVHVEKQHNIKDAYFTIFISSYLVTILQVHAISSELPSPDLHYQINVCMYACIYVYMIRPDSRLD